MFAVHIAAIAARTKQRMRMKKGVVEMPSRRDRQGITASASASSPRTSEDPAGNISTDGEMQRVTYDRNNQEERPRPRTLLLTNSESEVRELLEGLASWRIGPVGLHIKCKNVWVWNKATCDAAFGFQKNLYCMSTKRNVIFATRRRHLSCGIGIKKLSKNL